MKWIALALLLLAAGCRAESAEDWTPLVATEAALVTMEHDEVEQPQDDVQPVDTQAAPEAAEPCVVPLERSRRRLFGRRR